jgi:hypothetical protein
VIHYILVSHPPYIIGITGGRKLQMHDILCPIIISSLVQKLLKGMDTHSKHAYSKINKTQTNMAECGT